MINFNCFLVVSAFNWITFVKYVYCQDNNIQENKWNWDKVIFGPYLPDPVTLDDLLKKEIVANLKWGCITGADAAHHSNNRWYDLAVNKSEAMQDLQFLRGTTLWINEHLAVGHAMYDMYIIQLLQIQSVDRIVLQRAACVNGNQCIGATTWDGWFLGYFTAILKAFRPNEKIPIYMRWRWQEHSGTPNYLDDSSPTGYSNEKPAPTPIEKYNNSNENVSVIYPSISYTSHKCFENLFARRCNTCILNGMSESTINQFKKSAYSLVKKKPLLTLHFSNNPNTIYIVLAYRGVQASRHIENINLIINILNDHLIYPTYHITYFMSSHWETLYQDQIDLVARAHIVISEHGAFQSNMIYMRKGSLFIELRGNYQWGEFINFEKLANLFGLYYAYVVTTGLVGHGYDQFNITKSECEEVVSIIELYRKEQRYRINLEK